MLVTNALVEFEKQVKFKTSEKTINRLIETNRIYPNMIAKKNPKNVNM